MKETKIKVMIAAVVALAWVVGAALMLLTPARAQTPGLPMVPLGYCQIAAAALASSTPLSACDGGVPAGATMALLQAETANVRWRDDGVAPTTSVGMVLVSGQPPVLYQGTLSKLRFIAATGSPALNVAFYR